jgi:hypothetical protein
MLPADPDFGWAIVVVEESRAMRTSLVVLLGAAAAIAASASGASAQPVLNLTGQFQCVKLCSANPPALAYVTQAGFQLNLVNEAGFGTTGWIDYPGHIWVAAWNEGAIYSPDGNTIQFDRGTVWERYVAVPPAPLPPPLPRIHHHHHHHHHIYYHPLPPANS